MFLRHSARSTYRLRTGQALLAVCAWFTISASAAIAQLRDSFEGPEPSWSLKQADCGVRELVHERDYRESRGGQASEHFRLAVGNGTFVFVAHEIGRAPIIEELRPTLFVKADRPSLQLLARVILPRSIDRGTGQPISTFLRGDMYTAVGQWQQLSIPGVTKLLGQEVRTLRTQFGSEIDAAEAYIDLIVLNAYSGPGAIDLWIDELEVQGFIDLQDGNSPRTTRRLAASGASGPPADAPPPVVQGSQLLVAGRPAMVRGIQHHGEPLEWLRQLGFNTVKLASSPAAAEVKEARRLGMWLIAPPPYSRESAAATAFEPVIAWSLGSRLVERDLESTNQLIDEIRHLDKVENRPLLAGVDSGLADYGRVAHLLTFDRPTLGASAELADLRRWLINRPRLARPGTPVLATIDTQRSQALAEQLILLGRGAAWEEDCDPEQLRLMAFHAVAAGARGLIFQTPAAGGLAIDNGPAALRTDAIRLVNMELRLLEPWISAGQIREELAAGDGSLQVSVLQTDRSRLLVATQHAPAQQYVLGPPPRSAVSLLVPGVGASDQAYLISLAGIKPLKVSRTSGGARIALENAPHAAAIVVTQDPLAMHHLQRTLAEFRTEACRLRYDLAARRLIRTVEIDRQLSESGHPLTAAAAWLREAHAHLEQAGRLFGANDIENSHLMTTKAEHLLAKVRRGHWEATAAMLPTPAACPSASQFTTLPLHWKVVERISRGAWGRNVQAAGDMESLEQMLAAGWRQERRTSEGIEVDVSLSLADPRSGRSALKMQAFPTDPKRAQQVVDQPPLWITSSAVPVKQGQLVRIHGWVNVPASAGFANSGLCVFESLGGLDLADRFAVTQGWREFTLYRAVPKSGTLTVTCALEGLGEASLDDLSVTLLEPEPIRQVQ